jgi:chemotaxis family two-component system response regulator Rcp1
VHLTNSGIRVPVATPALRSSKEPLHVLQVEDNPADVRLTREAFDLCRAAYRLHVVPDGVTAVEFLRRTGPFESAPRPDLILLDLNLPKMDGREVLREIKADETLRNIPVVVLTTSSATDDIQRAYELHANCFITKPVNVERFFEIISEVERFWLDTATLPPR